MKKLLLIVFAVVLAVAFCAPAMAATNSATFYGNVRFWNWIQHSDSAYNGTPYSDTDLVWDVDQYDNRFGIRLEEGPIKANLEVRPISGSYFRQFWGSYTFGQTEVLMGFTWSPFFCPVTTSIYTAGGLQGDWGDMAACLRSSMIGIKSNLGFAKMFLALEPPHTTGITDITDPLTQLQSDTDTYLPRIELNLTFNAGPANVGLFGGYNAFKLVNSVDQSETLTSNIYGLRVEVPVGPVSLRGIVYNAKNMGNYGYAFGGTQPYFASAVVVDGDIEDSSTFGYALAGSFRFSDMISVDLGYGHAKYERYAEEEQPGSFYYIRFPITIAKGFTVTPEVGKLAKGDLTAADGTSTDGGNLTWYGLYWQINF
jgi:hypothetical protein